ncbi:hypothetical protein [Bacillus sp. RO1]|uniref:hypothetical protein n=1 Tax=Bacillus sp. RO1 TaxID=2722703 RepID=UPI001456EAA9|nr:hypothetical protein [Bacillus sp. RO1]NLP52056.1 hypothetical protein [Bacillus sp. RO1]
MRHFRSKNKYLAIRPELKVIKRRMKQAASEMDVAWIEELKEEYYNTIRSI